MIIVTVESAIQLIDDRIKRAKKGIEALEERRGVIDNTLIDLSVGMLKKEIMDIEKIKAELT